MSTNTGNESDHERNLVNRLTAVSQSFVVSSMLLLAACGGGGGGGGGTNAAVPLKTL